MMSGGRIYMVSRSSPNRVGVIFHFSSAVFLFPVKSVQQSCRPNNRLLIPQLLDVEGDQTKPVCFESGFDAELKQLSPEGKNTYYGQEDGREHDNDNTFQSA